MRKLALGVIGALVAAGPVLAHHDWPVDRTRPVTGYGYRLRNGTNTVQLQRIVTATGKEMYLYAGLFQQ